MQSQAATDFYFNEKLIIIIAIKLKQIKFNTSVFNMHISLSSIPDFSLFFSYVIQSWCALNFGFWASVSIILVKNLGQKFHMDLSKCHTLLQRAFYFKPDLYLQDKSL